MATIFMPKTLYYHLSDQTSACVNPLVYKSPLNYIFVDVLSDYRFLNKYWNNSAIRRLRNTVAEEITLCAYYKAVLLNTLNPNNRNTEPDDSF